MAREIWNRIFSREKQPLHTIGDLRIIVHPFFYHNIPPGNIFDLDESVYAQATQTQHQSILNRSIPQRETDITILMPATHITPQGKWDSKARAREEESFIVHPEIPTWKNLYETLRATSVYSQNVILEKDFILSPNNPHSVQTMRTSLEKNRSMIITSATNITLSGEAESGCVLALGDQLLRFTDISSFRIDKATTIETDDQKMSDAERLATLQRQPDTYGCIVVDVSSQ